MSSCSSLASCKQSTGTCFRVIHESKKTDVVLLIMLVASFAIGLAATFGAFNFLGTTNATSLAYSMYLGSTLFALIEAVRITLHYCSKKTQQRSSPLNPDHWTGETITAKGWRSPVSAGYMSPAVPKSASLDAEQIENIQNDINGFIDTQIEDHPHLLGDTDPETYKAELRDYILHVINDKEFQQDPAAYCEAWKKQRGLTEEYLGIQDQGQYFFGQYVFSWSSLLSKD